MIKIFKTTNEALAWLRERKTTLNLSSVQRLSGIPRLRHLINETPDGRGFAPTLASKHDQKLIDFVNAYRK